MNTGAGGYDWLEVWRRMYDDERAQAEQATDPHFARLADHWAGHAHRLAAASRESEQPDGFMRFVLPRLRPGDTVLDIGAGAGRYVPLLAAHVARVVAVEPSPAMRAHLEPVVAQHSNAEMLPEALPGGAVPTGDVALSAHVLYSIREIGPFLRALDASASRACYLFLALRHPTSFMSTFWERLRGVPRLPLPCALEALNALHQMGIAAHMQLVPVTSVYSYANASDALDDVRLRLRFVPDAARDAQIMAIIDEQMARTPNGALVPPIAAQHAAVLFWERTI